MGAAIFIEEFAEVFEIFHVSTLVRADTHGIYIFLNSGDHELLDSTIVTNMDHLKSCFLEKASKDVDCGVMAVK